MCQEIVFATKDDEEELQALLIDYGMGLAGDIQDHVLIKADNQVLAGAMVSRVAKNTFHLLVFAVRSDGRKKGIGGQLLQKLLRWPGQYCRNGVDRPEGAYSVTTIAKGESVEFYEKHGFLACEFSSLIYPYDRQCDACSEKEDCNPVAMMFVRESL
jgi:N-acetylglutamate synthase-like GNAT family acetyltransferase